MNKELTPSATVSTLLLKNVPLFATLPDDQLILLTKILNREQFSKNQIIWGGNYFLDYLPSTRGMLIWDKIQIFSGADFEFAWISFDTSAKAFRMRL